MTRAFDELTAADVMRPDVAAIPDALTLREAALVMAEGGTCAAPVTDARGRCVGLLLASHVLRWAADGGGEAAGAAGYWADWQMAVPGGAAEVRRRMAAPPPAVTADAPLREVARRLLSCRAVVVVDRHHRPLGVVSAADVLAGTAGAPAGAGGRPGPFGSREDVALGV